MAADVQEKPLSRGLEIGANVSHERECFVFNATSQDQAVAAIIAKTSIFPVTYTTIQGSTTYTFNRGSVSANPIGDGNLANSAQTWDGRVKYQLVGFINIPYQTGDSVTTFEIGFKSENVKFNPNGTTSTMIYAASPLAATDVPNFGGLINVTKDSVEGVDLDFPTLTWSETHYIADADVTVGYRNALYAVANAPINDDTFKNFAAGEVKFLGVTGTRRFAGGDWELNFKFAASPNTTTLQIGGLTGGTITSITKGGWDYVWVHYVKQVFTFGSGTYLLQVPQSAYVETLYEESDFSTLGIGT